MMTLFTAAEEQKGKDNFNKYLLLMKMIPLIK